VGTAVFLGTAGNGSFAMSAKSLSKKAIYTLKHDKEWVPFFIEASVDILSAFVLGAGFSSERL